MTTRSISRRKISRYDNDAKNLLLYQTKENFRIFRIIKNFIFAYLVD